MRQWLSCLLLFLLCSGPALAAIQVIDSRGQRLNLPQPAVRILSLAPHLTELLFDLGAGEQLVATVEFSDFPPAAKALPSVGSSLALDLERVLLYKPDLILAWQSGTKASQVVRLESLGYPVYVDQPSQLADIAKSLQNLGLLTGRAAEGRRLAQQFLTDFARIRRQHQTLQPVSVFLQVWPQPLYTLGGPHWFNEQLAACGGQNLFAQLDSPGPQVDREAVIAARPQVIFGSNEAEPDPLAHWQAWPAIPAVAQGHLYLLPSDLYSRPTRRLVQGAGLICDYLAQARASVSARAPASPDPDRNRSAAH